MEKQTTNLSNEENEWTNIVIQGSEYVISTSTCENSWKVSLSDLVEIWTETITRETALARCQSLNVLLDLETFDIKETLDKILKDIAKYATKISVNEIKLETCLEGITFKFNVNLTKGNPRHFWNEITKPLCHSSIELQRRQQILLDLIKRKDNEISQYKSSGAELIGKKKIETLPYTEGLFGDGSPIDEGESKECLSAFQSMMQLYNRLKKSGSSSINEPGFSIPIKSDDIKKEIEDPDKISETHSSEIQTPMTTTPADSLIIKNQVKKETPTNSSDVCKTHSAIKSSNPKKQCFANVIANVPSGSAQRPSRPKKPEQDLDIYKII